MPPETRGVGDADHPIDAREQGNDLSSPDMAVEHADGQASVEGHPPVDQAR
jgi:hypothetical protein